MIRSTRPHPPLEVQYVEVTDPVERARIQARQERARRNDAYWNAHAKEFYTHHRGKHLCVAGEEHFIADSAVEAEALGVAAHPEDDGRLVMYIPKVKMVRINAHRRIMVAL